MKIGVNWSGQRELPVLKKILSSSKIDFVEILIDNFLCVDPASISSFLDGIPVNFHIMNSRFINKDREELIAISDAVNRLADHLQPEYISDHIGIFYYGGLPLPQMAEISYSKDLDLILDKIMIWQELLGVKILIENYPSAFGQGLSQAEFYQKLIIESGCKLLFDISNAVVANINTGYEISNWEALLKDCSHFHIAGYEFSTTKPSLAIDAHAGFISESSKYHAKKILNISHYTKSISVERDDNFVFQDWMADIESIRGLRNE